MKLAVLLSHFCKQLIKGFFLQQSILSLGQQLLSYFQPSLKEEKSSEDTFKFYKMIFTLQILDKDFPVNKL